MPPAGSKLPAADRISHGMGPSLLVLSNGHGEDLIALRVIQALRRRRPQLAIAVLPLVGEGQAFGQAAAAGDVQLVGPRQRLPSGGFSNQSLVGLLQDLGAGLAGLSWRQWQLVRRWGREGQPLLAVGDLLPLLLAWDGGGPFGFIGTPKSDYTWASAPPVGWGRSPLADRYHRCKGSEWDPWEWALMASHRCRLVAVRDPLTARGLRRHGVAALAPGNPMTDGFGGTPPPAWLAERRRVLLLPGSRIPEAVGNAQRLLAGLRQSRWSEPTTVLLACGRQPEASHWRALMGAAGFDEQPVSTAAAAIGALACWGTGPLELLLGPGCFTRWAGWAELALATAGTATEQVVGLGIPALSLPGPGPQFKAGFARRQSRLLGGAVQPCHSQEQLGERLELLLREPALCQLLGVRGRRRMGGPGGSERLAELVEQRLLG
jgi:uncharacterized protein (TIGR03492 family)